MTTRQDVSKSKSRPFKILAHFSPSQFAGWVSVRGVLVLLCVLWTVPTFGLFISSLRDKDALATTGWWTALSSRGENDTARTGDAKDQEFDGERYVIKGNIFEGKGGDPKLKTFGGGFLGGELTDYKPGDVVELVDGDYAGWTFTVDKDGNYELSSTESFELDKGVRVKYRASFKPALSLDNYKEVLDSQGIGDAFINTLTVVIPSTVFPISIAAFAAYAFSWMTFPGRKFLFVIVVGLIVVPLQMALIPLQRIYSDDIWVDLFGSSLVGTYPGIWLAHTGFGLPLAIFLLRNYIGSLPREIIESAKIDGASHFQVFTRLVVPLSVPALASFAIFQFLWVWNDMLVALVFLGKHPDKTVLTVSLAELAGSRGSNWEIMTAAAFVSIAVPLLVFFALQRYFVRGLMAGSVKG